MAASMDELHVIALVDHWHAVAGWALERVVCQDRRRWIVQPHPAHGFSPTVGPEVRYTIDGRHVAPPVVKIDLSSALFLITHRVCRELARVAPRDRLLPRLERLRGALQEAGGLHDQRVAAALGAALETRDALIGARADDPGPSVLMKLAQALKAAGLDGPGGLVELLADRDWCLLDDEYYRAAHEGRRVGYPARRKVASRASAEAAARGVPVRYAAAADRVERVFLPASHRVTRCHRKRGP